MQTEDLVKAKVTLEPVAQGRIHTPPQLVQYHTEKKSRSPILPW